MIKITKLFALFVVFFFFLSLSDKSYAFTCSVSDFEARNGCIQINTRFQNSTGYRQNVYYHILAGNCPTGVQNSNPANGSTCFDISGQRVIWGLANGSTSSQFWFDNPSGEPYGENYYVWWYAIYTDYGNFCVDPVDSAQPVPIPGIDIVISNSTVVCDFPPAIPPGAPDATTADLWCNGTSRVIDFYYLPGSSATRHELRYGVGAYSNTVQGTGSSPIRVSGFSPNVDIYWNIYACNSAGCTGDPNGYYITNTGASCAAAPPTATPTPTRTPTPGATCTGAGKTCASASTPSGSCTTSSGASGTWQWDGQPSGTSCTVNPNTYCYTCIASGAPTATPPSGPTPTSSVGCSVEGQACIAGLVCCSGLSCSGGSCTAPGGGGCVNEGASCTSSACCGSLSCFTPGGFVGVSVCVDTSCGACQVWSPAIGACVSTCPSGQVCSGGVCTGATYTISGSLFSDANSNGAWDLQCYADQNRNGSYDSGERLYDESDSRCVTVVNGGTASVRIGGSSYPIYAVPGASETAYSGGASILLSQGNRTTISDPSGGFTFSNVNSGNISLRVTSPSSVTTTNPLLLTVNSNDSTSTFGIGPVPTSTPTPTPTPTTPPAPNCADNLDALPSIVEPDGAVSLDIEGCTNVESPPDGSTPPPYDWDPPQDDNPGDEGDPQCSDAVDNDGDGKTDTNDPRCHWDGDSTNPESYDPNDDNESPADGGQPQCNDGIDNDGDGYIDNPSDPECTSATDDNESDRISPNASGSMTCSDGGMIVNTTGLTSSTATWTAPACPTAQQVCTISTTVGGPGGTYLSSTNVTVRRSGAIQAFIHDISDGSACDASAPLYTGPAVLQLTGAVNTTETVTDGSYEFVCLPDAGYTVTLGVPDGYQMSSPASNFQSSTVNNDTQVTRFCISNFEPWYQTEKGDVRMRGIVNPIPAGLFGSTDASNPGVFHSTLYNAEVESGGSVSQKGWLINREYEYNELTANRNGTVAYSFYKSRARQEGVDVVELQNSTLDQNEIIDSGIYEYPGDLIINDYDHVDGRRVVILASGDITINTEIPVATGLLIVAAGGDITIGATVGHPVASFSSTASNLDGYYTAEGNVILGGTQCAGGVADERLNIAGAVIANARKPFASDGVNSIQNNRSLCSADDDYPTLYVSSRPDFLTQLTDFYKLSYTKWREVRP